MALERVFKITIDGIDKAVKASEALQLLADEQKRLSTELKELPNDSKAYESLANSINDVEKQINELTTVVNSGVSSFDAYDAQMVELAQGSDNSANSVNGLKLELEDIENSIGDLDIGSEEFQKLAVRAKTIEKTLESVQLEAEAVALGFVGIGKAGNTVEGLSVQMTALNAKLATLKDPLERAQIDKQIEAIKIAIVETEAEAKKGIFPQGSIGRLEAEFEALSLSIKNVPAGSADYKKLQAELDQTRAKVDFLNTTATEQQQIFKDLGGSITGAFVGGAGLIASFAGESEDAQQSLLILQQAITTIETLNQIGEVARQAREAKKVAGLALETTFQQNANKALVENIALQNASAKAVDAGGKSAKGAGGSFELLNAIIKANPIGAVIALLGVLGATVFALSSKFKPFAAIVNGVKDVFGGLIGAGKAVFDNVELIGDGFKTLGEIAINNLLNPLDAVKGALNKFFNAGFETTNLEKKLDKLGEIGAKAGESIADGFAKGVDKTRKLRALDAADAINSATDVNAQLEEAALGSSRSTSDARRAIRVRELKEDRDLAKQRVQTEFDLTEAELAIIRSGNESKIKELSKVTNARGEINKEVLDLVSKVTESDKAITDEAQAAFQEYIQDRISQVADALAFEQSKIGELNNFEKKRLDAKLRVNAEIQTLELQQQAGEFKSFQEFETKRLTVLQTNANELKAIKLEEAQFERSIRDQARNSEIENTESLLEKRKSLELTSFQEEKEILTKVSELRKSILEDEASLLDKNIPDQALRLKEIEQERVTINKDLNIELASRQAEFIDKELSFQVKSLELLSERIENEKKVKDLQSQLDQSFLDSSFEAVEKIKSTFVDIRNTTDAYVKENELITEQYTVQNQLIKDQYDRSLAQLELQKQEIALQEQSNKAKLDAGLISEKQFNDLQKDLEAQKESLKTTEFELQVNFDLNTANLAKDAKKSAEDVAKAYADSLQTFLNNPLDALVGDFLKKTFGKGAGVVKDLGEKIFSQLSELGDQLLQNLLTSFDNQIAKIDEDNEKLSETLSETESAIETNKENLSELREQLKDARDSDREAIIVQLQQEQKQSQILNNTKNNIAKQQEFNEQRAIALQKEKRKVERDAAIANKAIAITQAVINTALGIATTIGQVPKFDFGVSTAILVGLYTALGAAQVATISAQPIPEAKFGGLLDDNGELIKVKYATGGIVHGKSHANGGVVGTGKFNNVEVEGGEAIISKSVVGQYPSLIGALIKKGSDHTTPLPNFFESGGILPTIENVKDSGQDVLKAISQINFSPVVEVVEITSAQNRVKTIERVSSL
jgi:hypothetical protein